MARFDVHGAQLVVRLNALERLAAWHRRPEASLAAITAVDVLTSTRPEALDELVTIGLAATGAPLRGLATVGPQARAMDGRPAFVVTYLSGPAVLVRLDATAPWALMLVSSKRAQAVADSVRAAAPLPPA